MEQCPESQCWYWIPADAQLIDDSGKLHLFSENTCICEQKCCRKYPESNIDHFTEYERNQ